MLLTVERLLSLMIMTTVRSLQDVLMESFNNWPRRAHKVFNKNYAPHENQL